MARFGFFGRVVDALAAQLFAGRRQQQEGDDVEGQPAEARVSMSEQAFTVPKSQQRELEGAAAGGQLQQGLRTPRPALGEVSVNVAAGTPPSTSRRFVLKDGQVKGIANTSTKYHEQRPVRIIDEEFENRLCRALDKEEQFTHAAQVTAQPHEAC